MYSGVPTSTPTSVASVAPGHVLADRLGDAEVDDLGHRAAILIADQDVGGLEIAVQDPLLMRVLHGPDDLQEEPQPGRDRHRLSVRERRDRQARDQLHHEYGRPSSVTPASKTFAMFS